MVSNKSADEKKKNVYEKISIKKTETDSCNLHSVQVAIAIDLLFVICLFEVLLYHSMSSPAPFNHKQLLIFVSP